MPGTLLIWMLYTKAMIGNTALKLNLQACTWQDRQLE